MPDLGVCESLCRESGWIGQAVVALILVGRTLWVQWQRRQVTTENAALKAEVKTLSMRPPQPVTLQLAPHPSLASLLASTAPPSEAQDGVSSDPAAKSERPGEEPSRR